MAYRNIIGVHYESTKHLPLIEIAAIIRADIKLAVAAGELPKAKYSVRVSRSTHTRQIGVAIYDVRRPGFVLMNPHRLRWDLDNPHGALCGAPAEAMCRLSEEARVIVAKVEAIVTAYNFDLSEPESDYYHRRFSDSVDFAPGYVDRIRDAELFAMAMTTPKAKPCAVCRDGSCMLCDDNGNVPANDDDANAQEAFLESIGAL